MLRKQIVNWLLIIALVAMPVVITACSEQKGGDVMGPEVSSVVSSHDISHKSIGSRRYWVRNECWYSLDPHWLNYGDDVNGPGWSGSLSNWNWLSKSADANANGLRFALNTYGGYVSDLIPGIGGDLSADEENTWTDRLSSDDYGLHFEGTNVGHGTQCVAYVAMIIYRATGGASRLNWSWANVTGTYPSATQAQPGDLVFKTSGTKHVAVCVKNYGSGITVVESNWAGHEVIGRRDISNAVIGTTWKVYSGAGKWY